jgi:ribbon-helix-helix CopG family protein
MEKVMVAMTPEMKAALEKEAKARKLPGIQDLIRQIISDHLRPS